MLRVHSIESFWTHEWPWIRFVVFLQWCLFRCIYCHNPDSIPLDWWELMSKEKLIDMIKKSKPYFGKKWWVTFSWWEPLLQARELILLVKKLKYENIHVTIDTNWFVRNDDVIKLIDLVDLFLVDIKHIDPKVHKQITGQSNENSLKLVRYLEKIWKPMRIRYVLVPWHTDDKKHIKEFANGAERYNYIERVEILPYHKLWEYKWKALWREYKLEWINSPSDTKISWVKSIFEKHFKKVFIR